LVTLTVSAASLSSPDWSPGLAVSPTAAPILELCLRLSADLDLSPANPLPYTSTSQVSPAAARPTHCPRASGAPLGDSLRLSLSTASPALAPSARAWQTHSPCQVTAKSRCDLNAPHLPRGNGILPAQFPTPAPGEPWDPLPQGCRRSAAATPLRKRRGWVLWNRKANFGTGGDVGITLRPWLQLEAATPPGDPTEDQAEGGRMPATRASPTRSAGSLSSAGGDSIESEQTPAVERPPAILRQVAAAKEGG
jgi:hypothetical protein